MNKFYIIVVSFIFFGINVGAANAQHPVVGGVEGARIHKLSNWVGGGQNPNETLWVILENNPASQTNPAGCTFSDRFILDGSASDISKSMLLAASISGAKVRLAIFNNGCVYDRPTIVNVEIVN